MNNLLNTAKEYGQTAIMLAPIFASAATYFVTKDPQLASFTLMVTSMGAPEMSGHLTLAEGNVKDSPKPPRRN